MERQRRILVAPLDWGLGHATRCIPLISALLKRNAQVIIAASGSAAQLLKIEFPQLKQYSLPAYDPQYPKSGKMVSGMAGQLPHFIKVINTEHALLNRLVDAENIDVVIADNRYGFYTSKARSIFITHQLNILMPPFFKWMESIVNHFNFRQIRHFDECWIPAPNNTLIGALLPARTPFKTRYLGYLSRFEKIATQPVYDVAVVASGPEPQRSMFSNMLRAQLQASGLKTVLVRGEVAGNEQCTAMANVTEYNYLGSTGLNRLIAQSRLIIARSGYSTIMDLAKLEKNAVFIPTPGQTEQEYLAGQLRHQQIAFSAPQAGFDLKKALKEADKFGGFTKFEVDDSLLQHAIDTIL